MPARSIASYIARPGVSTLMPIGGGGSPAPEENPPVNTVAPVISGTGIVGQTLTSTTGTYTGDEPITLSYQWKRGITNVGTNSNSYTLVTGDAAANITCDVTATNAAGSVTTTSNAIGPIFDADAATYIAAVEAPTADNQALEAGVRLAINDFVIGMKADGNWTPTKAACILKGARTLAGALVPLVGPAPTNIGPFVSGDYGRKTGLTSSGTKELDTNRPANADPQDNMHRLVYVTSRLLATERYISSSTLTVDTVLGSTTGFRARANSGTIVTHGTGTTVPSVIGVSRASSANYDWQGLGQSGNQVNASTSQAVSDVFVFSSGASSYGAFGCCYYSVGEAVNLGQIETRVATLSAAINAAIP
jgi:hypothetical protein